MSDFIHLHCHTEYSLLDGAIRLSDLCARAKDYGMNACAITDHGNMFGAAQFQKTCAEYGIKPIFGCEVYMCQNRFDTTSDMARRRYHLILLARNADGYHNLVKIVSAGWQEGFFYKPRVDWEVLKNHAKGITCLSACLQGEVPQAILSGHMDVAREMVSSYSKLFDGHYYLELQHNGLEEQRIVNDKLLELAETEGIPVVATNDCHYLNADDVEAHDVLLCIGTGSKLSDTKRFKFRTDELYYKSPEQMSKEFSFAPEALENTVRIAEECNFSMTFGKHFFPQYALPAGASIESEFCRLAEEGLERRFREHPAPETLDKDVYRKRLKYEIDVILSMGFPDYFLIVQEFINWAKNNGVPTGPGRGSAAGSLVAWSMRITNLDPLPYNLLFERFLNNERVSLPDIDVDFCERRRFQVIRHMADIYGEESVSQIAAYSKLKARAVLQDVGRVLDMPFQERNAIVKFVPAADPKIHIKDVLANEPELKALYDKDERIRRLIDISQRLEGLSRQVSMHAAGLVVSDMPMTEYLPLFKGKHDEQVTQFDGPMVEQTGLVKFDFLGLKTMTLIQDALDNIRNNGRKVPNLDTLPFTDEATYELYSNGDTDGIFQVESSGMRQYLRMLRPSCFEDIIAMLALYRPGPLGSGMVDEFIKRKHGEVKVVYPHPSLESCLKDTYGVIVYQEQVMQIAQIIANYTLGGADLLRRAMGKKKAEAMAQQRAIFVSGAAKNGIGKEKADEIFDLMEKFAAYGFNKSHSAAYAVISYYTAYLKQHYTSEFMAALLTSEINNRDKLLKYISCCRDRNIEVRPPSVNFPAREFSVHDNQIIYGLGGIKGVGDEAILEIAKARQDGPFVSFLDLCERVNLRKVTKRVLEALIKSGALDCTGATRQAMLACFDNVIEKAQKKQKGSPQDGMSLFSLIPTEKVQAEKLPGVGILGERASMPEFPEEDILRFEKENLGFYLTSHPLQNYVRETRRIGCITLEAAAEKLPETEISTAVLVTGVREVVTKSKGERMAFVQVEDLTGHGEVTVFPRAYTSEVQALLQSDAPLWLKARTDKEQDADTDEEEGQVKECKLVAEDFRPLAEVCQENRNPLHFWLPKNRLGRDDMLSLRQILEQYPGPVQVIADVELDPGTIYLVAMGPDFNVTPSPELHSRLTAWLQAEAQA
ncbi:MAG: DNA polymerase III subunit alpha [Desulfovibrionaceae bacterium]|nr:DNA polymerase III subunit alpha [Desulfovibrionaceae bacterium]